MSVHRVDEQAAMSEINVTPLVDVMLVLLIVFIVTAPLLMQAVKVNLPKTAPLTPAAETRTVQIAVDAAGGLYLDQRPVALPDLEPALRDMANAGALDVQVHADEQVLYGQVAQVMAAVQRAGVPRLSFVTAASTPEAEPFGASAR